MKLLRKILIRSGIWGYFYPPYDFVGVKVHRDWPWKKKPLTADEIVSVQPMSEPSAFVFYYEENEE